ncbi:hypothetical protein EVG20_g3024 [Dentipellis fragilis]|uniref:3-dehydrosphinganine reductase n=1 Tax=Dentipellis fragilis TaxID=205917 RepID=A0A4Y9Z7A8_9AGAM|nr:hypothetical protein EVG20_g3024 [Dentipellis fragilis]
MLWSTKWDPADQHCYVTGGSSGLGLELSKILASRGAHVSIVARDEKKLASAIQEIEKCRRDPKQIIQSFSHSVLTAVQSKAALDDVVATHHGSAPDVVFLCAGKSKPRFFLEYTPEELSEGMDDAYWAQVWTAHAATRLMVEQDRKGKIVFVSSTLGLMTVPGYASYVPAKHALRGLADMLRTELILYGIDVHIFFPPTMLTPGYETENKTKPKITLKIEEGDSPLTAEKAAEILFQGVRNNQFQITGNFITELFRASSREASPRRNWFLDGFLSFLAYVSVPIWARSVDKLIAYHGLLTAATARSDMSDLATSVHRLYAVKVRFATHVSEIALTDLLNLVCTRYGQPGQLCDRIRAKLLILPGFVVASMTLLVYDTAVELIWSTKVNIVQIFYFISRYSPYLDTVLNIYAPNPDPRTCYITYGIGSVLTAVGVAFYEMILIIRTYALFNRSRKFLYIFGPLWIARLSLKSMNPLSHTNIPGGMLNRYLIRDLRPPAVIVICTIWKGITLLREVKSSPFMRAFYRDSILFYFAIFPLTIGNVIVFLTAPTELLDLFDTLTRVFHSLLCCRIILHLRAAGHGPITTLYMAPHSTVLTLTRPVECDFSMWDDTPEDQGRTSHAAREIEMVDRENSRQRYYYVDSATRGRDRDTPTGLALYLNSTIDLNTAFTHRTKSQRDFEGPKDTAQGSMWLCINQRRRFVSLLIDGAVTCRLHDPCIPGFLSTFPPSSYQLTSLTTIGAYWRTMSVDVNVGELLREARETFVGLFTWSRNHHSQHKDRRERVYRALAKHDALTFMESPNGIYPPWESLDYYRSNHFRARADPFQKAAAYGTTGTKAKIMMLFLWVIVQALPVQANSRVRSLVSDVVSRGLEEDERIGLFKDIVRELVARFCRPLPQDIEVLFADPAMALHAGLDYPSLLGMFRRSFPNLRKLEYDVSDTPSALLYRQEGVLVPRNHHTQRVFAWSTKRLSMGHRVTRREDLRDDVCWNAYILDPNQLAAAVAAVPPSPPPKDEDYDSDPPSRRSPPPSDRRPRPSGSSYGDTSQSSTLGSTGGRALQPGNSYAYHPSTTPGTNAMHVYPSLHLGPLRARAHVSPNEHTPLHGGPDTDYLHAASKVIELSTKLLQQTQRRRPRAKRSLICLALSIHPIVHSLKSYSSTSVPYLRFFERPRMYRDLPSPATAQKRASAVAAVLWLLGNRLPACRAAMLVSTAVEHGIMQALMLLEKGLISSVGDTLITCGAAACIDPYRVLCAIADVVEGISQSIVQPAMETATPLDMAAEDEIITTADVTELGVPHCALDVKENPSALLHRQTALLLPKTKLTMCLLERLIEDFGVGSPMTFGPKDATALWVVQFPPGHRLESVPSPSSCHEVSIGAASYYRIHTPQLYVEHLTSVLAGMLGRTDLEVQMLALEGLALISQTYGLSRTATTLSGAVELLARACKDTTSEQCASKILSHLAKYVGSDAFVPSDTTIAILVEVLKTRDMSTRASVSRVLTQLLRHSSVRLNMVNPDTVAALKEMVRSDVYDASTSAAQLVLALVKHDHIRDQTRELGAIDVLIDVLKPSGKNANPSMRTIIRDCAVRDQDCARVIEDVADIQEKTLLRPELSRQLTPPSITRVEEHVVEKAKSSQRFKQGPTPVRRSALAWDEGLYRAILVVS